MELSPSTSVSGLLRQITQELLTQKGLSGFEKINDSGQLLSIVHLLTYKADHLDQDPDTIKSTLEQLGQVKSFILGREAFTFIDTKDFSDPSACATLERYIEKYKSEILTCFDQSRDCEAVERALFFMLEKKRELFSSRSDVTFSPEDQEWENYLIARYGFIANQQKTIAEEAGAVLDLGPYEIKEGDNKAEETEETEETSNEMEEIEAKEEEMNPLEKLKYLIAHADSGKTLTPEQEQSLADICDLRASQLKDQISLSLKSCLSNPEEFQNLESLCRNLVTIIERVRRGYARSATISPHFEAYKNAKLILAYRKTNHKILWKSLESALNTGIENVSPELLELCAKVFFLKQKFEDLGSYDTARVEFLQKLYRHSKNQSQSVATRTGSTNEYNQSLDTLDTNTLKQGDIIYLKSEKTVIQYEVTDKLVHRFDETGTLTSFRVVQDTLTRTEHMMKKPIVKGQPIAPYYAETFPIGPGDERRAVVAWPHIELRQSAKEGEAEMNLFFEQHGQQGKIDNFDQKFDLIFNSRKHKKAHEAFRQADSNYRSYIRPFVAECKDGTERIQDILRARAQKDSTLANLIKAWHQAKSALKKEANLKSQEEIDFMNEVAIDLLRNLEPLLNTDPRQPGLHTDGIEKTKFGNTEYLLKHLEILIKALEQHISEAGQLNLSVSLFDNQSYRPIVKAILAVLGMSEETNNHTLSDFRKAQRSISARFNQDRGQNPSFQSPINRLFGILKKNCPT